MPTEDVAAEIEEIERRRLRSLVERQMDLARTLHADDYELITPGGRAMSKQEYLDEIATGELDYRIFEPEGPLSIRSWGVAAAVRYRVHIDVVFDDQHDSDYFWHTDIYELRDEGWQVVWSQATRIRKPP
jgi:hypothetical protein